MKKVEERCLTKKKYKRNKKVYLERLTLMEQGRRLQQKKKR